MMIVAQFVLVIGHYSHGCCRILDGLRVRLDCCCRPKKIGCPCKPKSGADRLSFKIEQIIPLLLNVLYLIFNLSWWSQGHTRDVRKCRFSLPDMDNRRFIVRCPLCLGLSCSQALVRSIACERHI